MKRFFSFLLVLVLAVSFVGCGGNGAKVNVEESAKAAFAGFMDALKKLDMQTAGEYSSAEMVCPVGSEEAEVSDAAVTAALSGLDYNMVSVTKVSGEQVEIVADISTVDLMGVFGQCTMIVMNEYMEGKITDEQMDARVDEVFKAEIAKEGLPVATNQVTVNVKKVGDAWKVELSQELQNAILGGFPAQLEAARPNTAN